MDPTDLLTGTLNNLSLFQITPGSSSPQQQNTITASSSGTLQTFSLYPLLPSELRLKILTHTFPPPTVLRVKAQVLLSDASFGLYITSSISTTGHKPSIDGAFQPEPGHGEIAAGLKRERMVALLGVCQETRAFYMERYGITLPSGPNGKGKIRVARAETLYIDNFPSLLSDHDFSAAFMCEPHYRLQNFWAQLEKVAVPVVYLMRPDNATFRVFLRVLRSLEKVKGLRGALWDGFWDGRMSEDGLKGMLEGIQGSLERCKGKIEEALREGKGGEGGSGYEVPKLEILED
ncbi:hypothetical protein BKA65DRAFT_520110 [Rhexocercosporidium sp. MPI-PUGE-AT-0058]|nr:hypothetical protein BKA65DRAFT_520110 [Rhexocercosporidium sp. MPI-PUGE-AT-0058]